MKSGIVSVEERIIGHLDKSGESFGVEDVREMRAEPPEKPHFPWIILAVAMTADVCDALDLDPTTVGAMISTIVSLIAATILFIWLLDKGGGRWKGKLLRTALKRFGGVIVIEIIPVVGLVPAWTLFVILVFYRETKVVQLFWQALEAFKGDLEVFDSHPSVSRGGKSNFAKNRRRGQQTASHRREVGRRRRSMDNIGVNRQRGSKRPSFNRGLENPSPFNGITQPLNT